MKGWLVAIIGIITFCVVYVLTQKYNKEEETV